MSDAFSTGGCRSRTGLEGGACETLDPDSFDSTGSAGGWLAGINMGPYAMSKEPRFPQLTMEQLSDAQKPLAEAIMKVSSVGIGGPYNPLLRSPVLGQRIFDLFHYLRWETSVPLRLNEFAILIIGRQ
jgi:4-carboxymuconolactone decarboxylase